MRGPIRALPPLRAVCPGIAGASRLKRAPLGKALMAKPKLTKHQREEALARKRNGETLTEIAKTYNVNHMTISRF
jgi:hypothetical protein